ncbi:MAG: hypothetical protein QG632_268 [Candidatus Dependentiae bacterium]|nr:hypothetical protein [Candidatus Dependentiae bacterium]
MDHMRKLSFVALVVIVMGGFCPLLVNSADCPSEREAMLMEDMAAKDLRFQEKRMALEFDVERSRVLVKQERDEKHAARNRFEQEHEELIRARNEALDALFYAKQHFVRIERDLVLRCEALGARVATLTKQLEEAMDSPLLDGSRFLP